MVCAVATLGTLLLGPLSSQSAPPTRAEQVRSVAATLRCPVCLNLSVADSTSGVARQMRRTIAQELSAGMTPDQIRSRFVGSYGRWILIEPPRRGLDLTIWLVPALIVAAGLVWTVLAVRRWSRGAAEAGGAEELA
ncbi:MAG TPA: cytochrome c-type biogenesis protein CcmH [Actinomycetota bacterium]|nr:cytochrome c-type biogenesis protein CcmH [Actinomycetota bacterium]